MSKKNNKYKRCISCVLDTTDPNIVFNDAGVCNYCLQYDITAQELSKRNTKDSLDKKIKLIKEKNKGKDYDVIVGLSGGVDSSYTLYLATQKYNLRALALHVDAGWNTEIAVANIHNAVSKCNADLYTEVIDWEDIKALQRSFFRASVINCDIPQDHAFRATQYRIANKLGIHDFISGRNFNTDGMMPSAWVWPNHDSTHIKNIHKKFGDRKLNSYPFFSILYFYVWLRYVKGYSDLRLLEYENYNRNEAKKIIEKELGWRDYGGKHYESIYTEFYQGYYLPKKFGFDKRLAHLSGQIKNGEITRDEALSMLNKPSLEYTRESDLITFVLKKLGFDRQEWNEIMQQPMIPHKAYKNDEYQLKLMKKIKTTILNRN